MDVLHAIGGHCEAESVLCTDGGRPGQRLASFEGLECIPIKGGKGSKGIYNIQRVNAFHPGLKGMVNIRFHGVATKYLNNYVAWYGFMHAKAMPSAALRAPDVLCTLWGLSHADAVLLTETKVWLALTTTMHTCYDLPTARPAYSPLEG